MDWFENWFGSPYYNILYQNRDEREAQEFVEQLLALLNPAIDCKMIDIACGEGRFARQLAGHGYDVTGIDISHASIATAKAFETDTLRFYVQDMRYPFCTNYFDFAFNFFTSFGYFAHSRDHHLAARSFAGALKDDGILVIDYLNRDFVLANLVPEDTIQRGSYTFKMKRKLEQEHFVKDISFTDAEGQHKEFTERVAAFSLSNFTEIFAAAGMTLIKTFGDYKLNPFNVAESPRLIMIFKKGNA